MFGLTNKVRTVTVFFTEGDPVSKNFRKLERAKEWLHKTVGPDLTRTVDRVECEGWSLAELECEPEIQVSVSVKDSMPEPSFEANAATTLEVVDEALPIHPKGWEEVKTTIEPSDGDASQFVQDAPESTISSQEALGLPGVRSSIISDPGTTTGHSQVPGSENLTGSMTQTPSLSVSSPSSERVSHFPCDRCHGTGKVQFKSSTGGDREGSCFRCAAQYKPAGERGKITAVDYRRNRKYDAKRNAGVTLLVRFGEAKATVKLSRTTEVYTPEKVIAASDVKPGGHMFIDTDRGDFVKVLVESVEQSAETIPA